MKINVAEGTERGNASHELDGLQLAAELELNHIAQRERVGTRQRDGLQRAAMRADIRRRQVAHGQRKLRHAAVIHLVEERSPHHGRRQGPVSRSEEHTSELQSHSYLVW